MTDELTALKKQGRYEAPYWQGAAAGYRDEPETPPETPDDQQEAWR